MHSCGDSGSVTCDCGTVESVDQYKHLGVFIDRKLNWIPHVQCVEQKLKKVIH